MRFVIPQWENETSTGLVVPVGIFVVISFVTPFVIPQCEGGTSTGSDGLVRIFVVIPVVIAFVIAGISVVIPHFVVLVGKVFVIPFVTSLVIRGILFKVDCRSLKSRDGRLGRGSWSLRMVGGLYGAVGLIVGLLGELMVVVGGRGGG